MKMEDGFVYMTKQEICDTTLPERVKMALATYGPLTARQLSYLTVGGTIGERISRVSSMCYKLRQRGELSYDNGIWRLV